MGQLVPVVLEVLLVLLVRQEQPVLRDPLVLPALEGQQGQSAQLGPLALQGLSVLLVLPAERDQRVPAVRRGLPVLVVSQGKAGQLVQLVPKERLAHKEP